MRKNIKEIFTPAEPRNYAHIVAGVAYAVHDNSYPELSTIRTVTNWGDDMSNEVKVPSVISYSPSTHKREQQFGASLSPDAVTMVNTKLELEVQDTRLDELDLIIQVLAGMKNLNFEQVKHVQSNPGYTWKGPEDIVTDYLTKVFEHFEKATAYLAEIKTNVPVDIVVTVPVVCLKPSSGSWVISLFKHRDGRTRLRILRSELSEMPVSTRIISLT